MTAPDPTALARAESAEVERVEWIMRGLAAWCESTPDISLSSKMRRDAAEFILAFPLAAHPASDREAEIRADERERCARVAALFAVEANATLGLAEEGSIGQAAVRGNVAAGFSIAAAIRSLPSAPNDGKDEA